MARWFGFPSEKECGTLSLPSRHFLRYSSSLLDTVTEDRTDGKGDGWLRENCARGPLAWVGVCPFGSLLP